MYDCFRHRSRPRYGIRAKLQHRELTVHVVIPDYSYITDDSHKPPEHKYYKELNAHDGDYYRRWANTYGTTMHTLIDRILRSPKHEKQAYNSCKGILHIVKDVPYHVVEAAA